MTEVAAEKSVKTKPTPYHVSEHLRTPHVMAACLDAWLGEAPEDAAGIARALGDSARANGRPPGPGRRYTVHFRQPGPGVMPLAPAWLER